MVYAAVVKLVDTLDLGSSVARRGGSSPSRNETERGCVILLLHPFKNGMITIALNHGVQFL